MQISDYKQIFTVQEFSIVGRVFFCFFVSCSSASSAEGTVRELRVTLTLSHSPQNKNHNFAISLLLSPSIFLLSTRNCYYFAIKSSSLIDLLKSRSPSLILFDKEQFSRVPVIFPKEFFL